MMHQHFCEKSILTIKEINLVSLIVTLIETVTLSQRIRSQNTLHLIIYLVFLVLQLYRLRYLS